MLLHLSDLTPPSLHSTLSHVLASARVLAFFLRDLALGPSPARDTLALVAKANYAAALKLQLCASAFPVADHWLTFLPSASACVEVPWFFTVLGMLVWVVGVLWLGGAVVRAVGSVVGVLGRGVGFLSDCLVEGAGWVVLVLGRRLGMQEVVPIVVVVDPEGKGR